MAGSRPPGEKRRDEDTLNASRRSDVSKYDPFWEPPPDERQAAWNKIAEAMEAYSVSTDASTLASLLREEAIVHFYMAEALERITDDPHQKSKAIGIKRSEAAQVESLPPRAVISEAHYEEIRELVESGRRESVWEAFHTNPSLASDLIAEDAKIDQTLRQAADSTLTFLLQAQARVQLSMALALARIAEQPQQKSRAIEILLDEAAQLTDRETICPALRWLESFEPLAVIPKLIAFLRKADDVPLQDAALDTLEHLILRGFAAYASESPATLTSECIIGSVESPGVPISPNLTIIRSTGQTFLVPRKDASQKISLDHTAALSPDLDLASVSFTTTDPAVQHTRMLISGHGANIGPAKAEQERFRDRYQALGTLVDSGEINTAVLKGPMAALNEAYRELDGTESERVIGVSKLKPSAPPGPATDYLTISQAAQRLGMDKRNVRYYIKKGGLEVVQFGPHSKLIPRASFEEFERQHSAKKKTD